jgi:hypothetical protein
MFWLEIGLEIRGLKLYLCYNYKTMTKKSKPKETVIYQTKSGALELRGDFSSETVWATQAQIAQAFDVDVRTINEHVINVYKTKELNES